MDKEKVDEGLISRSKIKIKGLFLSNTKEDNQTYTGVGIWRIRYTLKHYCIPAMLSWRASFPGHPWDSPGLCGWSLPLQYWTVQQISERYCGERQDVQEELEQDLQAEEGEQLHEAAGWCGGAAIISWKQPVL